jgi:hypothetical protein
MRHQGEPNFYYVTMFTLGRPVLLMSIRARDMMGDTSLLKGVELLIFSTRVSLNSKNLPVK